MGHEKKDFFVNNWEIKKEDRDFYDRFKRFCICQLSGINDIYYRFGYETFGIILYGFCRWMLEDLKKREIKQILFFSRDGYIMKKAFEKMPESRDFDINYIYVSRRSLRVPLLWRSSHATLEAICPTRYISIEDLLVSLGIEPVEYKDVINKYGFAFTTVVKDSEIEKNPFLSGLLDEIWKKVTANSIAEYQSLKNYLEQFALSEKVAVVDIGWRGSMQYYLNIILSVMGKRVSLIGYYITLSSSMQRGLNMHGYLKDVDGNGNGCDLLRAYVGLIETLFLKSEGSVKRYQDLGNGNAAPELFPCEYINSNGEFSKEINAVSRIQKGALDFIEQYLNTESAKKDRFSCETAFANLNRFGNRPTTKALRMFADFRFYNNGSITHLAKAGSLIKYIIHPRKLVEDFYGCRWRTGFMKNLFKIPLPYYSFFQILMKHTLRGG